MKTGREKPLIGVMASVQAEATQLFSGMLIRKTVQNEAYIRAVEKNGGIPLLIAPGEPETMGQLFDLCGGILLPGGEDIDPSLYGEDVLPCCGRIRPELDRTYRLACDHAVKKGKPVLGICKGMQFLNIYFGGSLYQDLSCREGGSIRHQQEYDRRYLTHSVRVIPGTVLADVLGCEETKVNTMHHQAVKSVGNGLRVSAQAPDGIVEGIESGDGRIIGVQWHPEELAESSPVMNRLFAYLVSTAASAAVS